MGDKKVSKKDYEKHIPIAKNGKDKEAEEWLRKKAGQKSG